MATLSKLRLATATLLLTCATNQSPIRALGLDSVHFVERPTTAELLQLTATLISVPATVLSLENPDFNTLGFLENASKAVAEGLSIYNHGSTHNIPWFAYDTVQSMRKLWAALHTPIFRDAGIEGADTNKSVQQEENSRLKLVVGILLALIEGGLRMDSVVNNLDFRAVQQIFLSTDQKAACNDRQADRKFWDNIAQVARLANYCLYTQNSIEMACWLSLFIICSVNAYRLDGRVANRVHVVLHPS